MKSTFPRLFVCSQVLLLSGIASAQLLISSEAADAFVTRFEAASESDMAAWKRMADITSGVVVEGAMEEWVQPVNKKEPCRMHAVARDAWWANEENRAFWDGECRSGYAYGIGREFATIRGELSSWLVDYKEPGKQPTYHLVTHYDRKVVQLKAASPPYYAELSYQVNEAPTGANFTTTQSYGDFSQNRIYRQVHVAGTDQVLRVMALPNKNSYFARFRSDTVLTENMWWTADATGQLTGYAVGIQKGESGVTVRHQQLEANKAPQEARLPETYLRHLTDVNSKINQNLGNSETLLREAFVAVNIYKRRVCQGQVAVDFVSPEIYGRICLDSGELSPYTTLVSGLNEQKEKRHVQVREEYARKKAETTARQQMDQAQRRPAEANRGQTDDSGFGRALAEFASTMGNLHQQSSQFTQSYMNSQLRSPGGFGSSGGTQTNCVLISNVVNCRTR